MTQKSWKYGQLEGIRQALGPGEDLILTGTNGKASFPGLPDINLEQEFGEDRVMNYTAIDELWYFNVAYGSAVVGAGKTKAICHHGMYMANAYPYHHLSQHVAKDHHMTGGQATVPFVHWAKLARKWVGGAGQHSDYEEDSWFMHIPGVRTVIPSTPYDAKGLMISAIRSGDPVVYIDFGGFGSMKGDVPDEAYEVPFGKAAIRTTGNDLTIVSSGGGMVEAQKGTEMLKKAGMSVELIDLRSLNPMDTETLIKSVQKTKRLLTFDLSKYTLAPGAEVIARVAEGVEGAKFKRIAHPDAPPAAAPEMYLWARPDENNLVDAAKKLVG
jgi:pyruvate dehydrogenase E1 component beta subunit